MNKDDVTFESSGGSCYANNGIIGLCVDNASENYLMIFEGYDGGLVLDSKGDSAELSAHMMAEWFKAGTRNNSSLELAQEVVRPVLKSIHEHLCVLYSHKEEQRIKALIAALEAFLILTCNDHEKLEIQAIPDKPPPEPTGYKFAEKHLREESTDTLKALLAILDQQKKAGDREAGVLALMIKIELLERKKKEGGK